MGPREVQDQALVKHLAAPVGQRRDSGLARLRPAPGQGRTDREGAWTGQAHDAHGAGSRRGGDRRNGVRIAVARFHERALRRDSRPVLSAG